MRRSNGIFRVALWAVPAVLLSLVLLAVVSAQPPAGQGTSVIGQAATAAPVTEVSDEQIQTAPYEAPSVQALYVLDLNIHTSEIGRRAVSYVRVIDPKTGQGVLTIPTRSSPNIALSSDRRYLYILDSYVTGVIRGEERLALSIHDLQQGRLVSEIALPAERTSYIGFPTRVELLPTLDGTKLYVLLLDITRGLRVLTVNTQTYQIMQDMATKAFCDGGWLSNDQLMTTCSGQLTAINVEAKLITPSALRRPDASTDTVAVGVASAYVPQRQHLYALSPNGSVLTVFDLANQTQMAQVKLDIPANAEIAYIQPPTISPDSAHLYLGFRSKGLSAKGVDDGAIFGQGSYLDQIGIFELSTGRRTGWIDLAIPVVTLALSQDGQTLYGASPQTHSVSAIDVASGRVNIIKDVGDTPVLIVPGQ